MIFVLLQSPPQLYTWEKVSARRDESRCLVHVHSRMTIVVVVQTIRDVEAGLRGCFDVLDGDVFVDYITIYVWGGTLQSNTCSRLSQPLQ